MRSLPQPNAAFSDDLGEPDPDLRTALATAYSGGNEPYLRAVADLCTSRLLLPVVATGDASGEGPDPDRHAEMAAVLVEAADGARAVVVFTGMDALSSWNADARPVPCTLDDVAATAQETGSRAVLVDIEGPHSLVIEHPLISELAQGHRLVEVSEGQFGWLVANPDAAGAWSSANAEAAVPSANAEAAVPSANPDAAVPSANPDAARPSTDPSKG